MIAIAILCTLILCSQILVCALLHQVIHAISTIKVEVNVKLEAQNGGFSDN